MSIWSARHHNPDAHIVLLTDDKTDRLLTGTRGELLNYVTEKIVVPFEDENASMMYRSRWIKTSVRGLVVGDFLFIDCDTICCGSLVDFDSFFCVVGAVGDNNVLLNDDISRDGTCNMVSEIGCDISGEEYYFSSGVIYCKDTPLTHEFYRSWNQYWMEGASSNKVFIDQPSLAKTNINYGHLIEPLSNIYNCVLYTQNTEIRDAIILHIPAYRNSSFLFSDRVFNVIKVQGLNSWVKIFVLNVHATYLPFDYEIRFSNFSQRCRWIKEIGYVAGIYRKNVDKSFNGWDFRIRYASMVRVLYSKGFPFVATSFWLFIRRLGLFRKKGLKENVCAK